MNVADVMSTQVVTIDMDDRLTKVKEILDNTHFHHLLVMEGDILQGIISDRDLLRCLSPFLNTSSESLKDKNTIYQRAHQIMTRSPLTITPDISIKQALHLMIEYKIGCLPVIKGHELQGIFTWTDGVLALLKV